MAGHHLVQLSDTGTYSICRINRPRTADMAGCTKWLSIKFSWELSWESR
jgi:hypothetical protein